MKAYFGALIDKSASKQNAKLTEKLQNTFKRYFRKATVNSKEHNTFLFLEVEKSLETPLKMETVEKVENKLSLLVQDYHNKNKIKLKKLLKEKQELKETSQIVKEFLKVINQKLPKTFESNLKKLLLDLPNQYFEVQQKSMTLLWNLTENNQIRFFLSGCDTEKFSISGGNKIDLEEMTDKLVLVNFFLVLFCSKFFKQNLVLYKT
jgi:hypothetical protein